MRRNRQTPLKTLLPRLMSAWVRTLTLQLQASRLSSTAVCFDKHTVSCSVWPSSYYGASPFSAPPPDVRFFFLSAFLLLSPDLLFDFCSLPVRSELPPPALLLFCVFACCSLVFSCSCAFGFCCVL